MKLTLALSRPRFRSLLPGALTLALLLLLTGCSDDGDEARRELRANRALWRAQGLENYRFVQQKSCFCGPDYVKPTQVEVRDGVPTRAVVVAENRLLPAHLGMTVEDVFARIEQAIDGDYEFLDVRYDAMQGYPTEVSMNPGGGITDAGFGITCSDIEPLDAVSECLPPDLLDCDCSAAGGERKYRYTAWDESGAPFAEGCVILSFTPRDNGEPGDFDLTGRRCVAVRCADDRSDAHHGAQAVGGSLDASGAFWLDLNAGWADLNVFLSAEEVDPEFGYIGGTWTLSTLLGPQASGTFLLDPTSGP